MPKKILKPASGGSAHAEGDYSYAEGGAAGDSSRGIGGDGGDAHALGAFSIAVGGRGGRGGISQGAPGGDAVAQHDGFHACYGGNGGEAAQHDGRGGRGGTAQLMQTFVGDELARRARMKLPYGAPNTFPGRGGDTLDTPQYMARRLIVEKIKLRYFIENNIPTEGGSSFSDISIWPQELLQPLTARFSDVWYDRTVVPIAWINDALRQGGNKWNVSVEDEEYVFSDKNTS